MKAHEVRGTYSMTMSQTIGVHANEVPAMTARQRLIVVLLLGANFMMSADFSILNIALPVVGEAVGLSVDNLPWISTAFALPAAGLSLLFGRLGDLYGWRGIFWPKPYCWPLPEGHSLRWCFSMLHRCSLDSSGNLYRLSSRTR